MDSHFLKLLQTNEAPSELVIRESKNHLANTAQELRENQDEMDRLAVQLERLKDKQTRINASRHPYNTILSPIRRIPQDVLTEIFYHCIPTHRNPIMSATEAPVLLTRICSGWRTVALYSPRLWAKLHIPLPGSYQTFAVGAEDDEAKERFNKALEIRSQVIEQWLSRSGTRPLSLSLSFPSYLSPSNSRHEFRALKAQDGFTHNICVTVASHAHRWQNMEISVPWVVYHHMESFLSISNLRQMRSLRLNIHGVPGHRPSNENAPVRLLEAPNIQKLSLCMSPKFSIIPSVRWDQLTYLIFPALRDLSVLPLLKLCHNLVNCDITVDAYREPVPNIDSMEQEQNTTGIANLPRLKYLHLGDSGSRSVMNKVFKCMHLTSLEAISYFPSRHTSHTPLQDPQAPLLPFPLLTLLQNTTGIKKLALGVENMQTQEIVGTLNYVGFSLTHLALGKEICPPRGQSQRRHPRRLRSWRNSHDNCDLDLLTVDTMSDAKPILLPHLEILVVYQLSSYSDKDLLGLITGRIIAWKRGKVAALKLVKITFDRERQLDITDTVVRCAQAAGLDIKLDLDYPIARRKGMHPLSPSYGLTTWHNSPWISYEEMEDTC